jgi:signal transduction histidine kinase
LPSDMNGTTADLLRQRTVLAKFGELALSSESLDEILTEACRLVSEGLGTDLAKVMQLEKDETTLLVRAGVGWKPGVVGVVTLRAVEGTSEGYALKTGEPMISPDIETEKRFIYPPFLIENGVRAVANVVIAGNRGKPPFGILQVDSRTPRQFTDNDTSFLRSYANLLAGAVERLSVVKELEERVAERTRELTEANAKLQTESTERARVEDAMRQTNKMEAIGQLTGGLAHDFNNLLAGISGNLELMETRAAQGRTADLFRYITSAKESATRAASLTQRLLAFSRRQTLDPKRTDENALIRNMHELFSRTIGPAIHIETKLPGELWPALCDPNQLENALLNLVINARDAMPDGGHIMIETANAVLPDRRGAFNDVPNLPPGDYVALIVTDRGVGMSPDVLARAFDPFFTTKPTCQGTGLGLSMVYGFAQQSGGHVHLLSKEGQGTTATIYLPRDRSGGVLAAAAIAITGLAPSQSSSAVVLVVEDEAAVRMIVTEVLGDSDYTVLEAGDARSGLSLLESGITIGHLEEFASTTRSQ